MIHIDIVRMLDMSILDIVFIDCLLHDEGCAASCSAFSSSWAPHWVQIAGTRCIF